MRILVIGGGNMGTTYAQSFLRSHVCTAEQMMILEKNSSKASLLSQKNIGTVYADPEDCIPGADIIILAVKPQDIDSLFDRIRPLIDPQQVFLSIMAGVKISTIANSLGVTKIIRAMPNLPAQIGMGMTAFTSTEEVTRVELVMVQNLLNTTGKTVYVESETAIDAATAISGSGPAYVFYFMDAMIRSAQELGFTHAQAELLVTQTFRGAVDLYNKTDFSCTEWIQKVSSKGGTTEAAIKSMQSNDVLTNIMAGAKAAFDRAEELGKQMVEEGK